MHCCNINKSRRGIFLVHLVELALDSPHTKCCGDISICGGVITTSGLKKITSAILDFYIRLQF